MGHRAASARPIVAGTTAGFVEPRQTAADRKDQVGLKEAAGSGCGTVSTAASTNSSSP